MSSFLQSRKLIFERDKRFHDVTFKFPNTTKQLTANKTILALGSPVFEAMFFGALAENRDTITLQDDYSAFQLFLS